MAQLGLQEQQQGTGRFGLLRTRPASATTTVGTGGTSISLLCNYFAVLNQPNWRLYQYHVDYAPVIDSKRLRIALLRNHEATLFPTNKAFDGMTLYSTTHLREDVNIHSRKFRFLF